MATVGFKGLCVYSGMLSVSRQIAANSNPQ